MHVEEKRIDEVFSNSKLSDVINPIIKHHKRFQRADESHRNVKQRMNDAIKTEEFSSMSCEIQSAGKYDTSMSESNAVQQLEHVSWKYKNPYSVSISNSTRYQESNHAPALIVVMAQATARSLWALIYVIVNIAPIIQMFSFILRFVLDKIIDIRRTKNIQQVMVKFAILAMQLLSVYVCLIFILGFIVFPIVQMAIGIVAKFVMHN
ncbi:uncharacterized protein LOC115244551 isoform X2 [Formica exsecta]|uniref:uncharacterized protein LOC115244551 isoform X2 n=1 Tax=Formica exsecta TaxID=72781 RepID=UPI0011432BC7|nr:uncharacterized protein LOC115244551 isoform X2 [Formica exsecta]